MGMHVRGGSQWKQQTRRENSIPLRRACPASGATWNVQVVRGKMSTRCLWHACRALMVGILLMIIGASMATIGYYSQDFPLGEFRHNTTIRVKNEQRGLHLNNLSYLGPIIMGVGGFIVVASCVMTFEARDSAAKVVPARFKLSTNSRSRSSGPGSRRTTTSVQSSDSRKTSAGQSGRWEHHLGLFKSSPGSDLPTDRHALTAALIHFSRTLGSPKFIPQPSHDFRRLSKSGSVPNLNEKAKVTSPLLKSSGSPNTHHRISRSHHNHHHHHHKHSSLINRATRESSHLHPGLLRYHRHAISVDETSPLRQFYDSAHGSQVSVTFDPTPEIIDIVPVHKKRIKHSDTARRHILSRQRQIEKEDVHNSSPCRRRRSSTLSENSIRATRKAMASTTAEITRRASSASRSYSIDSRNNVHNVSAHELYRASPERQQYSRKNSSILSMDKENCRSQLSICSEPMATVKQQLSCQSSIEPCVVEEESGVEGDEKITNKNNTDIIELETNETQAIIETKRRPDSLILNTTTIEDSALTDAKKYLYRSQSTRSFKKPKKLKPSKILSSDLDQIYVISSNTCTRSDLNDFYDSIEVITERRSKNFMEFNNCSNNNNCSSEYKANGDDDDSGGSEENGNKGTSNEIIVEVESHDPE